VLRRICPRGILGDHAFHDGHHPALVGHVALAQAVLDAICARKALGWRDGPAPTVDPAETVAHFGIGKDQWATACALSASAYLGWSLTRYDPSERVAKYQRLRRASLQIAQGVPPEAIDVPGFGVPPAPPR
jgi:hypothetical protein